MTEERRREPRLDALPLNLFVYDNLSNHLLGTLVNISNRGMMILASSQCDPGGVLQVDLRSAEQPDRVLLAAGLKVAWTSPASTAGSHWIGGRFIGIDQENARALAELIRRARDNAAQASSPA